MKKVLFWVACPLTVPLFLIIDTLMAMGESVLDMLHRFEGWCFDYEKDGWERIGDGIWVDRTDLTD